MLDSWLAVLRDGSVLASVGKIDAGMGIGTSFAQIVADELDVPFDRVTIRMGDTATTVDQRGTGSSNGIMSAGPCHVQGRRGSAPCAARHGVAASRRSGRQPARDRWRGQRGRRADRHASYAELIGGKRFDVPPGGAKPKAPAEYRLVGLPVPRADIPAKVKGVHPYLVDHRLPGMLHARVIRPPQAGAHLVAVRSNQRFPGLVKVVAKGDFVAVVCRREEQAIRAARELKLDWSRPAPMFAASHDELYRTLRTAAPKASKRVLDEGDVEEPCAALHACWKPITSTRFSRTHRWNPAARWPTSGRAAARSGWAARSRMACARRLPACWASRSNGFAYAGCRGPVRMA